MNERIKELAEQAQTYADEKSGAFRGEIFMRCFTEKFAELVEAAARKDEREACAKLCDAMANHPEYAESATTKLAAYAIRSRSGTITLAELRKTDLYRSIQTQPLREALK